MAHFQPGTGVNAVDPQVAVKQEINDVNDDVYPPPTATPPLEEVSDDPLIQQLYAQYAAQSALLRNNLAAQQQEEGENSPNKTTLREEAVAKQMEFNDWFNIGKKMVLFGRDYLQRTGVTDPATANDRIAAVIQKSNDQIVAMIGKDDKEKDETISNLFLNAYPPQWHQSDGVSKTQRRSRRRSRRTPNYDSYMPPVTGAIPPPYLADVIGDFASTAVKVMEKTKYYDRNTANLLQELLVRQEMDAMDTSPTEDNVQDLEKQVEEHKATIVMLKDTLAQTQALDEMVKQENDKYTDMQAALERMEKAYSIVNSENEQRKLTIDQLSVAVEKARAEMKIKHVGDEEFTSQLDQAKSELQQVQDEYNTLTGRFEVVTITNKMLEEQKAKDKQKITELNAEATQRSLVVIDLQAKSVAASAKAIDTSIEIQDLKQDRDHLKRVEIELTKNYQHASDSLTAAQDKVTETKQEVSRERQKNEELQTRIKQLEAEKSAINDAQNTASDTEKASQAKIVELRSESEQRYQENKKLEEEIKQLKNTVIRYEQSVEDAKSAVKRSNTANEDLEQTNNVHENEINKLENLIQKKDMEIDKKTGDIRTLKSQAKKAEKETNKKAAMIEKLQVQIKTQSAKIEDLKQAHTDARDAAELDIESSEEQLEKLKTKLDKAEKDYEVKLKKVKQEHDEERKQQTAEIENLQKQLGEARYNCGQARQQDDDCKREKAKLEQEVAALKNKLPQAKKAEEDCQKEKANLEKEAEKTTRELEQTGKELREAKELVAQLTQERQAFADANAQWGEAYQAEVEKATAYEYNAGKYSAMHEAYTKMREDLKKMEERKDELTKKLRECVAELDDNAALITTLRKEKESVEKELRERDRVGKAARVPAAEDEVDENDTNEDKDEYKGGEAAMAIDPNKKAGAENHQMPPLATAAHPTVIYRGVTTQSRAYQNQDTKKGNRFLGEEARDDLTSEQLPTTGNPSERSLLEQRSTRVVGKNLHSTNRQYNGRSRDAEDPSPGTTAAPRHFSDGDSDDSHSGADFIRGTGRGRHQRPATDSSSDSDSGGAAASQNRDNVGRAKTDKGRGGGRKPNGGGNNTARGGQRRWDDNNGRVNRGGRGNRGDWGGSSPWGNSRGGGAGAGGGGGDGPSDGSDGDSRDEREESEGEEEEEEDSSVDNGGRRRRSRGRLKPKKHRYCQQVLDDTDRALQINGKLVDAVCTNNDRLSKIVQRGGGDSSSGGGGDAKIKAAWNMATNLFNMQQETLAAKNDEIKTLEHKAAVNPDTSAFMTAAEQLMTMQQKSLEFQQASSTSEEANTFIKTARQLMEMQQEALDFKKSTDAETTKASDQANAFIKTAQQLMEMQQKALDFKQTEFTMMTDHFTMKQQQNQQQQHFPYCYPPSQPQYYPSHFFPPSAGTPKGSAGGGGGGGKRPPQPHLPLPMCDPYGFYPARPNQLCKYVFTYSNEEGTSLTLVDIPVNDPHDRLKFDAIWNTLDQSTDMEECKQDLVALSTNVIKNYRHFKQYIRSFASTFEKRVTYPHGLYLFQTGGLFTYTMCPVDFNLLRSKYTNPQSVKYHMSAVARYDIIYHRGQHYVIDLTEYVMTLNNGTRLYPSDAVVHTDGDNTYKDTMGTVFELVNRSGNNRHQREMPDEVYIPSTPTPTAIYNSTLADKMVAPTTYMVQRLVTVNEYTDANTFKYRLVNPYTSDPTTGLPIEPSAVVQATDEVIVLLDEVGALTAQLGKEKDENSRNKYYTLQTLKKRRSVLATLVHETAYAFEDKAYMIQTEAAAMLARLYVISRRFRQLDIEPLVVGQMPAWFRAALGDILVPFMKSTSKFEEDVSLDIISNTVKSLVGVVITDLDFVNMCAVAFHMLHKHEILLSADSHSYPDFNDDLSTKYWDYVKKQQQDNKKNNR